MIVYREGGIRVRTILEIIGQGDGDWVLRYRGNLEMMPDRGGVDRLTMLLRNGLLGSEAFAAECADVGTLGELIGSDEVLLRRLPDTCLLDEGRLIFRHGYLFDLVRDESGVPRLIAWPFSYGETGLGVFCATPGGEILGNPNDGARFSGPTRPLTLDAPGPDGSPIVWREVSALQVRTGGL